MDRNVRGLLLAGVGGAALAWAAVTLFGDDPGERREPRQPVMRSGELPVVDEPAEPAPVTVEPVLVPATSSNDVPPTATTSTPAAAFGRGLVVIDTPSTDPARTTDLPNRRADEPDQARAADELLNTARISCDFGGGTNTGLRYGATLTVGGSADWGGGLIVYDLFDATAGEARMSGSPGATGTETGETKVQLLISGARLTFLGELRDEVFVVTTIYPEIDNVGRHVAVMSRHEHGSSFTYAGQFLGTCQ